MSKNILGIFGGDDIEGVSALMDRLEKSSFDYLKLEGEGMSVTICKNGACEGSTGIAAPAVSVSVAPAPATAAIEASPASAAAQPPSAKTGVPAQEGMVVVKSPSYGIYYSQPEPGAAPYITEGSAVKTGDTVGLIEIMKTFNAISSPVDGVVMAIHVRNEEVLEPDQPLVSIKVNAD